MCSRMSKYRKAKAQLNIPHPYTMLEPCLVDDIYSLDKLNWLLEILSEKYCENVWFNIEIHVHTMDEPHLALMKYINKHDQHSM